ncbi:hypothetical protein GCM10023334_102880 [Nonomuraea thailandensis]
MLGTMASIGAGVPPLVVPAGWPLGWRALIAVVVAALAGATGSYFGVVLTRAEDAAAAIDALRSVLDPLDPPQPHHLADPGGGERSVFELLLPQWCPTPFWGRRAEGARWRAWCQEEVTSGLMVVDGPGGCGKTRLALQAAREAAADGWVTGWLREGMAVALVCAAAAVTSPRVRVLALVDDADTRTDLAGLLGALAEYRGCARLRVVLITRHGAELGQALQGRLAERHALLMKSAPVMSLRPLGEISDLIRWYGEAVRAFASARATLAPPVSDMTGPVRKGQAIVEVFAQAMVTVLGGPSPGDSPTPLGEVARVLFEHEARWWRGTAAQEQWGIGPATDLLLARVMTGLVLFAPADEPAAIGVLRRVPELADAPAERITNLARWARALYSPMTEGGLRIGPDPLTDWFVITSLTSTVDDRHFARHLLNEPTEDQAARILTVLARASEHHPPAQLLFEQLLGGDPVRLARYAIYAALTTGTNRGQLDHTTATALAAAGLDPDTTTQLLQLTPAHALPRCTLTLTRRHLHHNRATGTPPCLARALTDLAAALDRAGEREEGLRVALEAVALWRELTDGNTAHRPGLATALTDLAATLDKGGEHHVGLRVALEAVALWRELTDGNTAHRPGLATALSSLSSALDRVGEHREQLRVAREAVALWRELTDGSTGLASALTTLSVALNSAGEHREDLRVAQEAVALWRELTDGNTAYSPDLATALNNLAAALYRAGKYHEALPVARESVALWRDLVDGNTGHSPTLARTLNNLAGTLGQVGEHHEQLRVQREAVALYRELAAHDPELFHQAYIDTRAALRRLLPAHDNQDDVTVDL